MEYPPSFMDFYTGVWYNLSSKFVYNEEILCTGSREKERVYVGEFPVAAINSLRRRIA